MKTPPTSMRTRPGLVGLRRAPLVSLLAVLLAGGLAACGDGQLVEPDWTEVDEAELGTCNEANCRCFLSLTAVMNGQPYNADWINANLGPPDARDIFFGGGSENIPVTCRTAKYYVDHDPAWLTRYFDVQLAAGSPYLLGGEPFSSVYTALVVGDAIAALAHARARGHSALASKASSWLASYWAYLSLASVDARLSRQIAYNKHGVLTESVDQPGYNTAIVGARSYVNGFGGEPGVSGNGVQHLLLSMALEHRSRRVSVDLRRSPGYWGGVRAAVEAAGYRLDGAGKVSLSSRSVPPGVYGLTGPQRAALAEFVSSGGQRSAAAVLGLLESRQLGCTTTIVRTTGGLISWFGTSDSTTAPCNGRKGGSWAVARIDSGGTAEFLTRSSDKWGGGDRGVTWREGDRICGRSSTLPTKCLTIPSGALVYEVVLGKDAGVRCVAGSCAPGGAGTDTLLATQALMPTQSLRSPDGRFKLVYQTDGNLVLRGEGAALWATGTHGTSAGRVLMRPDGNLVVLDTAGQVRWQSGTAGHAGAYARVRDGGRVVVCSSGGARLWSTDGRGQCGTPPAQ